MNPRTKIKNLKSRPCCEVVKAEKELAAIWPAVHVANAREIRGEFEANLAWCFEFRASFRDGSKRFCAWKIMGRAADKAEVYERLKRRADDEGVILIEMCHVSPAMTAEQVQDVKEINEAIKKQAPDLRLQTLGQRHQAEEDGGSGFTCSCGGIGFTRIGERWLCRTCQAVGKF